MSGFRRAGAGVRVRSGLAALALLCLCVVCAPAQELRGVWVTSSAAVDTSTPEAIVAGLVKPEMSDEQKALAIFNWYRRVIYPHAYLAGDRRDLLRQINSYGNTLCGSHAANLGWLMRTAGFKTRCVFIDGGGHTFVEVWYADAWHSLDAETDFAVWSRGENPHLINMEELKAEPALLDDAEKEGRAKPWLFKAMKYPWTTRKKMAEYCDAPATKCSKANMQWSSAVLRQETIKDYFQRGVKSVSYSGENEVYGAGVSDPALMKLRLRPDETLVRRWSNEGRGKYIAGQGFGGYPAHLLYGGGADESDEEVFRYVEPYRKDNYTIPELPVDRCYRYSGNGHLVWSPDVASGVLSRTPGVRLEGLVFDEDLKMIRPETAGREGVLVIPIRSSYALVCAEIKGTWLRKHDEDVISVAVRADRRAAGEVWACAEKDESSGGAVFSREINGLFNYELQIRMKTKADVSGVGLKGLVLDHTFVNNWLALPYLAPGENTIRVRLDNPEVLKQVELQVRYDWEEGEDWKESRSEKMQVTGSPFEFKITAKGPKYPRMKELTLSAKPLQLQQ